MNLKITPTRITSSGIKSMNPQTPRLVRKYPRAKHIYFSVNEIEILTEDDTGQSSELWILR